MTHSYAEKLHVLGSCLAGLMLAVLCLPGQAQEVVYRCGQEYTNAPRNAAQCERLSSQAITVVSGTRPSGAAPALAATEVAEPTAARTKVEPTRLGSGPQNERDAQARTIVAQELDKARQQLVQLLEEYNQGEPVKWAAEARNHQKYLDRVAALKASIERTERDIDSLQRELARRPVLAKTGTP